MSRGLRKMGSSVLRSSAPDLQIIPLLPNIMAYKQNTQLLRETENDECDKDLMETVMSNYIIVKRILSYLDWQDKAICKAVCSTWYSAVVSLQKEQLGPVDFVMDLNMHRFRNDLKLTKSGNFYTEPLVVFTFVNEYGIGRYKKCNEYMPPPCDPPCDKDHYAIDYAMHVVCAPKKSWFAVLGGDVTYRPLPFSPTYPHSVKDRMLKREYPKPFIGGVYIPCIPKVKFQVCNIRTHGGEQKAFCDLVDDLARDNIFKGVLVYVTHKTILHNFLGDCDYLNYFKEVQPDIPYALGGCIVEDYFEQNNLYQLVANAATLEPNDNESFRENLISIGMFTMPKDAFNAEGPDKTCFEMFSLVIKSKIWSTSSIQKAITEFAKSVPRFEHSMALKLSCVGRDEKLETEEQAFRTAFPYTRILGCFGNGELGLNHPPQPTSPDSPVSKRKRRESLPPPLGLLYSYATIFVYFGWGKMYPAPN